MGNCRRSQQDLRDPRPPNRSETIPAPRHWSGNNRQLPNPQNPATTLLRPPQTPHGKISPRRTSCRWTPTTSTSGGWTISYAIIDELKPQKTKTALLLLGQ